MVSSTHNVVQIADGYPDIAYLTADKSHCALAIG
jgi:hypothetical protein